MATTYLTWTPSGDGDKLKWTFSAWVKRTNIGSNGALFFAGNSNSTYSKIVFSSDSIDISEVGSGSTTWQVTTNRKFRDCNAFYHIVVTYDSAQATASNRVKLYINGVQETSFSASNYPTQNKSADWFGANDQHRIGRDYVSQYFAGVMSHIHICNGYAYSASDFGETDSTTGEWKIKTSPSVSYGNYGSWILKDGNTITDSSPNSNNWTLGAGAITKSEDNPSNVFNTMTALAKSTKVDLSNGGCTTIGNTTAGSGRCSSNWNIPSYGKWYFEYKMIPDNQGNTYPNSGIKYNAVNFYNPENSASAADIYVYGTYSGELIHVNSGTNITSGAPATSGDIFGWSVDMDNGAIYIHRNGTYINSGNPTSGSSKTGAIYSFTPSDYPDMCVVSNEYGNSETQYNFGNGYFATTAVSSAGTNASGNGIFEYDVPTGFTALSTKGLNL